MNDKREPNIIVVNYKQDSTNVVIKTLAVTRAVLLTAAAYLTFKKAVKSFLKKDKDESKGE